MFELTNRWWCCASTDWAVLQPTLLWPILHITGVYLHVPFISKTSIIYRYHLFSFPVGGAGSATDNRQAGGGELLLWRWKLRSKCHGLEFLFGLFPVLFWNYSPPVFLACSLCSPSSYLSRFVLDFGFCCHMYFLNQGSISCCSCNLLSNSFNLLS